MGVLFINQYFHVVRDYVLLTMIDFIILYFYFWGSVSYYINILSNILEWDVWGSDVLASGIPDSEYPSFAGDQPHIEWLYENRPCGNNF